MPQQYGLGRLPQHDERNAAYPIRGLIGPVQPRSYTWACPVTLDQGQTSSCVGNAFTHDHAARPRATHEPISEALALDLYREAQRLDPWPGEDDTGTSVLAGAQAAKARGWIREFRWSDNLDDVLAGISRHGPVIFGIDWHEAMFTPDEDGVIRADGPVVGGHAILGRGVSLKRRAILLHNSWGPEWGRDGDAWLPFAEATKLLRAGGECCLPVKAPPV